MLDLAAEYTQPSSSHERTLGREFSGLPDERTDPMNAMHLFQVPTLLGGGFRKRASAGLSTAAVTLRGMVHIPQLTAKGAKLLPEAAAALATRTSVLARTAAKGSWDAAAGTVNAHRYTAPCVEQWVM